MELTEYSLGIYGGMVTVKAVHRNISLYFID